MTALIPLHFDRFDLRTVIIDGEPWWVLNDVCGILEIANPRTAANRLDDYQKGVHSMDTLRGAQNLIIINEAGIYALTLSSRKDQAKAFARWLFTDVLPSIRKHGSYPAPETRPSLPMTDEDAWTAGARKTVGKRFREERLRWEAANGMPMAGSVPQFTKPVIRAIEDDAGGLSKGRRMEILLHADIDVLYILNGRRTMTGPERALRDAYRDAAPERRQTMMAQIGASLQPAERRVRSVPTLNLIPGGLSEEGAARKTT